MMRISAVWKRKYPKHIPGGSTPSQYALPEGATEIQDLIEYREMNHAVATIFEACYRTGHCAHSNELRNMHKVRWFADREIARLTKKEEDSIE